MYGLGLIFFIIKPKGFSREFIDNYKNIQKIKSREKKIYIKIQYLTHLIKNYKNKDSLTIHYLWYYKFNYLTNDYEEYK